MHGRTVIFVLSRYGKLNTEVRNVWVMTPCTLVRKNQRYEEDKVSSVDKKNQLDVTFCILYFSSNSFSTCFGQPCAHHQELTTA